MVHISYHLGCHYNSIRRLDDTCEDDVIPIENKFAIGIDLKQVPKMIRTLDYEQKVAKKKAKKVVMNVKK